MNLAQIVAQEMPMEFMMTDIRIVTRVKAIPTKRNPIAKKLNSRKFQNKIEPSKKRYCRKGKSSRLDTEV